MANKNSFFTKLFKKTIDRREIEETEQSTSSNEILIRSAIKGNIIPLSEVKDEAFSQGMMGKGVAIIPSEGKIYSPITGTIASIFPTKHAICLVGSSNEEILIHVGMDTVNLKGKYYKSYVKDGDKVRIGDLILEFDIDKIKASGFEVVTPITIVNSSDFTEVKINDFQQVNVGEVLITLVK